MVKKPRVNQPNHICAILLDERYFIREIKRIFIINSDFCHVCIYVHYIHIRTYVRSRYRDKEYIMENYCINNVYRVREDPRAKGPASDGSLYARLYTGLSELLFKQ